MSKEMNSEQLTLFAGDSPASPLAVPGSVEAQKMTATSGRKCSALLRRPGPLGSLGKMLLESSRWSSDKCFLIWRARDTNVCPLLFQLAPSMPRTGEIEYGLLPTPNTIPDAPNNSENRGKNWGGKRPRGKTQCLREAAGRWPTPSASMMTMADMEQAKYAGNSKNRPSYKNAKKMWPTPAARDGKGPNKKPYRERGGGKKGEQLPNAIGGQLNPQWVSWLMGFPIDWCDLPDELLSEYRNARKSSRRSETPSSRKSLKKSARRSLKRIVKNINRKEKKCLHSRQ